MKLVLKENAVQHKNGVTSVSNEYETGDRDINIALVEINGRYPNKGRMYNTVCKELIYVVEGNGKLFIDGKEFLLKAGDVVLIEPKEKYFWDGKLKVIPACTPAWYIDQVKLEE